AGPLEAQGTVDAVDRRPAGRVGQAPVGQARLDEESAGGRIAVREVLEVALQDEARVLRATGPHRVAHPVAHVGRDDQRQVAGGARGIGTLEAAGEIAEAGTAPAAAPGARYLAGRVAVREAQRGDAQG